MRPLAFHVSKVETEREETVMKKIWTRILLGLIAFGTLVIAGFLVAAGAHADPTDLDNQYLAMLRRDGVTSSSGAADLIQGGHFICQERMAGNSESAVVSMVYQGSKIVHIEVARAAVYDAEQVYCPGYYVGGAGTSV